MVTAERAIGTELSRGTHAMGNGVKPFFLGENYHFSRSNHVESCNLFVFGWFAMVCLNGNGKPQGSHEGCMD